MSLPDDPFTARPDSRRLPPEIRYRQDPQFHALVDTLYLFIRAGDMTPTEVREAAILATTRYEYLHIRPIARGPLDRDGINAIAARLNPGAASVGEQASGE